MTRREKWELVLTAELERWSAKAWPQLLTDLTDGNVAYEVTWNSEVFQVEVDLLEDTPAYLNVCVAVDDESLLGSVRAACRNFIVKKTN